MTARRVFYGWYVVSAMGVVMTTTAGLAFYNLPVLLDAFVVERAFPVSLTSAATASFFVASALAGLAAGQIVDRYDPRYVIIVAACGGTLALGSIGFLREPWQLFAFYIFFGACYGGCGLIPTTTIVTRWFETKRALAMSIASTGLSLGGMVLTPISAFLIQKYGLAGAGPWIALAFFVGVVPAIVWIVRSSPRAMGLDPDGVAHHESVAAQAAAAPSIPFAEVWRSRFFISVAGTYMFALGSQVGGIAHIYRLASLRADAETAAFSVAVLATASLIGRLLAGWLLARVPSRAMTQSLIAIQTVGLVLLAFVAGKLILICVAIFGLTAGSMLMMQPLLLAEAFGIREYGRIYSVSLLAGVIGYAIAPTIMGLLFEATSSYTAPYLAVAGLSLVGLGILSLSGPARRV
jgi:MFS family permease